MKYIPKTLPTLEVEVPEIYHDRVMEVIEAFHAPMLVKPCGERPYLDNVGVRARFTDLGVKLDGRTSAAAKAYDLLYLTLLVKEVEHDRNAVRSAAVQSGQFEADLIGLVGRLQGMPDPTYLDEHTF